MKGFGCAMDIVKVGRYPVMENATMNIGNWTVIILVKLRNQYTYATTHALISQNPATAIAMDLVIWIVKENAIIFFTLKKKVGIAMASARAGQTHATIDASMI